MRDGLQLLFIILSMSIISLSIRNFLIRFLCSGFEKNMSSNFKVFVMLPEILFIFSGNIWGRTIYVLLSVSIKWSAHTHFPSLANWKSEFYLQYPCALFETSLRSILNHSWLLISYTNTCILCQMSVSVFI